MNLFKQKKAKLFNGKEVKERDCVFFVTTDGDRCEGAIQRRKHDIMLERPAGNDIRFQKKHEPTILKKGTLFFWNDGYLIEDYITADTF